MAERFVEIRDYCIDYCARQGGDGPERSVAPIMFRLDYGGLIFGFYSINYNRARAASIILRKAGVYSSEKDILRMLEEGVCEDDVLESLRVISDHITSWEALEQMPACVEKLIDELEKEARLFVAPRGGTRQLKPRIEQDARNYNAAHYGNRTLVPMVLEMGRAGVVFGFFDDSGGNMPKRAGIDSILLERATSFNHKLEIWDAVSHGYTSRRRVRVALEFITHYYSLSDMQELADNEKAIALIAAIRPRAVAGEGSPEPPSSTGTPTTQRVSRRISSISWASVPNCSRTSFICLFSFHIY